MDREQIERLEFARQMLAGSKMSLTSVAALVEYTSVASFTRAFEEHFGCRPNATKVRDASDAEQVVELKLDYQPPMHWDALLGFFHSHQIIGVEQFTEESYSRVFRLPQGSGSVHVSHDSVNSQLCLRVSANSPGVYYPVVQRVRQMFDLDFDPVAIGKRIFEKQVAQVVVETYPGLRVASGWDPFEVAICTILGQLVSTKQATSLIRQLVAEHGEPIHDRCLGGVALFPTPEVLADAALETVRTSPNRKKAIRAMAGAVANGVLDFYCCDDVAAFKEQLLAMPGIGPWTAEYIGLRAMRDKDSFPRTDLFLKRSLADNPDLDLNAVRPWRSYAAIYLWKFHTRISPTEPK